MAELVRMRFIRAYEDHVVGDIISVTKATAGLLEAKGVAVRVRRPHAPRKPITGSHTVKK